MARVPDNQQPALAPLYLAALAIALMSAALPVHAWQGYEFRIDHDGLDGAPVAGVRPAIDAGDAVYVSNGHFYKIGPDLVRHTRDDQRVRFLGINLTPPLTFPRTDKEADRLIARIARLGFNIIRLHGLDADAAGQGNTLIDLSAHATYPSLNASNLAALDRLFRACKRHGIYVSLALKVAYTFRGDRDCYLTENGSEKRCVPSADAVTAIYTVSEGMPAGSRPLDLFDPTMIELQKQYYDGLVSRYANDPVLALVELNNENSLIERYMEEGSFPPLYARQLDRLWNRWLARKYGTTKALRIAWAPLRRDSSGHNIILNGDFSSTENGAPTGWQLVNRVGGEGKAYLEVSSGGGVEIDVEKSPSPYWSLHLAQEGIGLRKGAGYCISLRGRADRGKMIEVALQGQKDNPGFRFLPRRWRFRVSRETQSWSYCFVSPRAETNVRLVVMPETEAGKAGKTWISTIALREVQIPGLPENTFLVDEDPAKRGNVPRPGNWQAGTGLIGLPVLQDYFEFLAQLEEAYYQDMLHYLRHEVGLDRPVTGTQANYGGLLAQKTAHELMDYLDVHYYWDHPRSLGRGANAWWMRNTPMERDPRNSIIRRIVEGHIEGKPLTIGEFSPNMLNDYAPGGLLLAAAYGAYQDIDGLFLFNYFRAGGGEWNAIDPDQVLHWYNVLGHTGAESLMPVVRNVFLRGDVIAAGKLIELPVDASVRRDQALRGGGLRNIAGALEDGAYFSDIQGRPFNVLMALRRGVRLLHSDGGVPRHRLPTFPDTKSPIQISDTGQLKWKSAVTAAGDAWFSIDSKGTKAVSGDLGRVFSFPGVTIEGRRHQYGIVAVTALDGRPIGGSRHVLIAVIGEGRSRNLVAVPRGSGYTLCTPAGLARCDKPFWHPEAGPFVMNRLSVNISLMLDADSVVVWALDEQGSRKSKVPVERTAGGYEMILGGRPWDSPWFEVVLN